MKKQTLSKLAMAMAFALTLTACGGGGSINSNVNDTTKAADNANSNESKSGESKSEDTAKESAADGSALEAFQKEHPAVIHNDGTPVENATLKVAIVTDSTLKGVFNPFLFTDGYDDEVMKDTMMGAFPTTTDFKLVLNSDTTPIKVTFDEAEKTVTYKINPKFKWSDGSQVTTADIVKTYDVTANNDYIVATQSVRYNDDMHNIVGIEEYNEGKADKISGLEVIDDSNMKIHLKEMTPGVIWGGPFASEFVNAKQLEGIPMDKINESDAFRKNPLSYGPYYITNVVAGEKVSFTANPYYIYGEPKVKNVEFEVIPSSQQVAAAKSGNYDIIKKVSTDVYPELAQLNNIKIPSRLELYMSYLTFKLGKWDSAKNEVVPNPNAKMADPALRKAMAHAIDNDMLGKEFYHGLRFRALSPIAAPFKTLLDPNINGTPYDLELAKKLLDDAGYKDTNGDGIRENKDGSELTINYASMSGSEVAEPIAQYYLQQWKSIGLNVELVDGRLLDFNNFYDRIQSDDPAIDVYSAAFGQASDPNPVGIFGKSAAFNFSRYTSPELQTIIDKLGSAESMDPAQMQKNYYAFEAQFEKEAFFFPMMNRVDLIVINNRVSDYDFGYYSEKDPAESFHWSDIQLLADAPIADK